MAEALTSRKIHTVYTAVNGQEVVAYLKNNLVDLVLMDLCMPIMDGIEATKLICKTYPTVKVLVLSGYDKDAYVRQAIEAGAHSYMVKDDHPDEIAKAIHTIIGGGHYYSPAVFKKLAQKNNSTNQKGIMKLSPREIKILDLLSNGCTSDEISVKVEMSIHTGQLHIKFPIIFLCKCH